MKTSTPPQHVLAIDLGSGGPKVILVSDRGEVIAHAKASTSTILLPDGGAEQSALEWWSATSQAAKSILSQRLVPPESIVAVGCDAQWSVTVPVDQAGEPLMNAVHWMDGRGAQHTSRIMDGFPKVAGYGALKLLRWLRLTGGAPTHSGNDSLAHVLFIKHDRPDVYRKTHHFLEPADFLCARLSGRQASTPATAFPLMLADLRRSDRIDYDPGLLRLAGLDREKLPEILQPGTLLGPVLPEVADDWGLPRTAQVVVGTSDSQAAVLGSGAVGDFEGHVCIGTSCWLSCHVPFKKTDIFHFLATMPAAISGRNMVMAEQGAAGKCLELFVDQWLLRKGVDERAELLIRSLDEAASAPAGSDGLIFLPWLNGAGPPSGESSVRGGFLNQSLQTTRAHALRAILEGVSFNLRWVLEHIEPFIKHRLPSLRFIGGGARSELWCQTLADVMNRPIEQVVDPHFAIARGAAYSALLAMRLCRLEDLEAMTPVARRFEPTPSRRELYDGLFQEFLESYRANRRIFARLGRKMAQHRASSLQ